MRIRTFAATAAAVASLGLTAAACGSSTTSGSAAPSPGASSSSAAGGAGAYGGGSAPTGSAAPSSAAAGGSGAAAQVGVRTTSLGTFLVDGQGRTLYLFEKDTSTASTCTGACAVAWPPFTTKGPPHAGSGVNPGLLGTTSRSDGTTEVTYHGHPLYYFIGDKGPGTTKGEGLKAFGAGWYVLNAAGNKIDES